MSRWRTCSRWLLPLGILGAVTCSQSERARVAGATGQAEPAIDPRGVAGTYELRVCRLACPADPDRATARAVGATLRRGYLVLSDTLTGFEQRKDSIGILLGGFMSPPSNGCFKLDIVRADPPSYAYTLGGTHWALDSSGTRINFGLYYSPDAGYGVTASVRNDTLRGKGESWGAGVAAVDYPPDVIEGRRIGPPDLGLCLAAVGPAWQAIRSGTGRAHNANGEW